MHQHHIITSELAALHRRDLLADAERGRRIPRRRDRVRSTFGRR